jgi:hypothetical protein
MAQISHELKSFDKRKMVDSNSLNILNFSRIRKAPENFLLINLTSCNLA